MFFVIYEGINKDGEKVRQYDTIPLNVVIERQKQGLPSAPEKYFDKDNYEYDLKFTLSPNDLVYVPSEEEIENSNVLTFNKLKSDQVERIMTVNDFTGVTCYFTPNNIASAIVPKEIDSSFDTKTAKLNSKPIKEICMKLEVDRLGNITNVKNNAIRKSTFIPHL